MASQAEIRRADILDTVRHSGHARVDELAERFDVSVMTIHRDLDFLAEEGQIERVRGGAKFIEPEFSETNVETRRETNVDVKKKLASYVATLVSTGDIVALDDSTTVEYCVPDVLSAGPVGIITHSLKVLNVISAHAPEVALTGAGGRYCVETDSFLGQATCNAVERLNATVSIVSTTCINAAGIYHPDEDAAITKSAFVRLGTRKILVSDSSKFDNVGMHFVARLSEFDDIVMDNNLDGDERELLEKTGARLHLVDTAQPTPTLQPPAVLK